MHPAAKTTDYKVFFNADHTWNSDLFDGLMFIDCTWCARCCKENSNHPAIVLQLLYYKIRRCRQFTIFSLIGSFKYISTHALKEEKELGRRDRLVSPFRGCGSLLNNSRCGIFTYTNRNEGNSINHLDGWSTESQHLEG